MKPPGRPTLESRARTGSRRAARASPARTGRRTGGAAPSPTSETTAGEDQPPTLEEGSDQAGQPGNPGHERAGEQAALLRRRLALEDERGSQAHNANLGVLALEAVEAPLDLDLLPRVSVR